MLRTIILAMLMWACALAAHSAPNAAQILPAAPAETAAPSGPAKVKVGIYINDIHAVDLPNHAFSADFYVWFRWADPSLDPVRTFELMNQIKRDDDIKPEPLYDAPLPQPDGTLYQLARAQGLFSEKFSVAHYPFDDQRLRIAIEDRDMGADELVYEVDSVAVNPDLILPGYRLGAARLTIADKPYPTAFGDLQESAVGAYSRVTLTIPILRPWLSGAVKKFLPITLIILCASTALLLAPRHVDAQIGLTITALLALVASQFAMANDLPEVGYLLLLDQVYIASYAFILLLIGIIVLRSRDADEHATGGRRIGGVGVFLLSLSLYAIAVAAILSVNLFLPPTAA